MGTTQKILKIKQIKHEIIVHYTECMQLHLPIQNNSINCSNQFVIENRIQLFTVNSENSVIKLSDILLSNFTQKKARNSLDYGKGTPTF